MRNLTKALAAVSLLVPASGHSLGIGDIKLHSALNQNLKAEITLVVSANEDVSDIKARLAPPEKFDEAGVPWSYFLSKIKFKTEIKSNGLAVITLTSNEALKEPFLDFLVEVTWPKGSLYREFTVLIDPPPTYAQLKAPAYKKNLKAPAESKALITNSVKEAELSKKVAKPVTESTKSSANITTADAGSVEKHPIEKASVLAKIDALGEEESDKTKTTLPQPATVPTLKDKAPRAVAVTEKVKAASGSAATDKDGAIKAESSVETVKTTKEFGPTKKKSNLYRIAKAVNSDPSISVQQMMYAIYKANPEAFYDDNINSLRANQILKIPTKDTILKFTPGKVASTASEVKKDVVVSAPAKPWKRVAVTKLKLRAPREHKIAKKSEVSPVVATEIKASEQESAGRLTNVNQDLQIQLKKMQQQLATMEKLLALKEQKLAALEKSLKTKEIELAKEKTIAEKTVLQTETNKTKQALQIKEAEAKADADKTVAQLKAAADAKAKADAAKTAAELKAVADAKAEAELKAKADAAKTAAELKAVADAKAAAELKAKAEAELKAKADAAKTAAELKAVADAKAAAELKAKAEAELKAKADAAKTAAELKAVADAKAAAELKAKAEAELKAKADAAKTAAELKAVADAKAAAELKAKAEAELKAKADAAKTAAELKAVADAKAAAELKAKAEAELKAKAMAAAQSIPPSTEVAPTAMDTRVAPPKPLVVSPEPVAEEDWMTDPYILGVGGGGIFSLGLLGWLFWRKRKVESATTEVESMFTESTEINLPDDEDEFSVAGIDDNSSFMFGGESSFLSDDNDFDAFEVDQDEVDPISEADVYLAYGRYQQAEELIRQAIEDLPDRDECKFKLLEIFCVNGNTKGFEDYVRELADAGKRSNRPFWSKVVEMGHEIIPDSPLLVMSEGHQEIPGHKSTSSLDKARGGAKQTTDDEEFEPDLSIFDTTDEETHGNVIAKTNNRDAVFSLEKQTTASFQKPPAIDNGDIDLSMFDEEPTKAAVNEVKEQEVPANNMEFDLSMFDEEPTKAAVNEVKEQEVPANNMEFDLSMFDEEPTKAAVNEVKEQEVPANNMEFDLSMFDEEPTKAAVNEVKEQEVPANNMEFDLSMFDEEPTKAAVNEVKEQEVPANNMEFDLSSFDTEEPVSTSNANSEVEFDLSSFDTDEPDNINDGESEVEFDLSSFDAEFDASSLDKLEKEPVGANSIGLEADSKEDEIEFDLSDFDASDESELEIDVNKHPPAFDFKLSSSNQDEDEFTDDLDKMNVLETKIDLAKAYIDMGDLEAAKAIAEKVLKEGNDEQKAIAQQLIKSLL